MKFSRQRHLENMRRLVLALLILIRYTTTLAQADVEVNVNTPDLGLLDLQTFHAVNDLRLDKKLTPLAWDDVLHRAAKDHAEYLIKEKSLSHNQRLEDKRTPFKRVKVHGGLNYGRAGENLVSVQLGVVINLKGRKLSTQSYTSAGKTMAQLWKASPLHYRNILENDFNMTAVATAYDPVSQRLVGVQVFGFSNEQVDAGEQPDHSQLLLGLPVRKLPFGLKEIKQFRTSDSKSLKAFMKLKNRNGTLYGSYRTGKKAFRTRRSGIAVERIPLSQYDSGAIDYAHVRNRRNGLYSLNGELERPVFRREMLKVSRRLSPKRLWVNLRVIRIYKREKMFCYPVSAGAGTHVLLINKKRLITYTTPLALPAKLLNEPLPKLRFKNSFSEEVSQTLSRKEVRYDTIEVKVFYPSRVVKIDTATERKIVDAIGNIHGRVVRVEASAYASVDGDMSENHKLAEQRANEFMQVIKPYLDTVSVMPRLVGKEQWELFIKQIEMNDLSHLRKMHRRELRIYVNAHKNDSLIQRLLAEQRFTLFKIVVRHDTLIALPPEQAVEKYYVQKKKFESLTKRTAAQATLLERAQLKAYGEMIAGNMTNTLEIVKDDRYPAFQYHDLMFNYMIRGVISDQELYNRLHKLGLLKSLPSKLRTQLVYNNMALIYSNFNDRDRLNAMMNVQDLYCARYRKSEFHVRYYRRLRCWNSERIFSDNYYLLKEFPNFITLASNQKFQNFNTDSLSKFYTISMINELYGLPFPRQIFDHVAKVKPLYHPNNNALSLDQRVRLAFFYCAFDKLDVAKSLLAPVVDDPKLDPEGRKLFITLQFNAFRDEHDFVKYLIDQHPVLGNEHWCSLLTAGKYLSHVLLEDARLKKFYNCKCKGKTE